MARFGTRGAESFHEVTADSITCTAVVCSVNRRTCLIGLGAIGTPALVGCLGGDDGGTDSGFALVEHDFDRPENSLNFTATVENNTDQDHNIDVELEVKSGDSLLDEASFEATVRPGETGDAFLTNLESPGSVTDYLIRLSEGPFPDLTVEREFSGETRQVKYLGGKWFENSRQLLAGIARSQVRWTPSNAHHERALLSRTTPHTRPAPPVERSAGAGSSRRVCRRPEAFIRTGPRNHRGGTGLRAGLCSRPRGRVRVSSRGRGRRRTPRSSPRASHRRIRRVGLWA